MRVLTTAGSTIVARTIHTRTIVGDGGHGIPNPTYNPQNCPQFPVSISAKFTSVIQAATGSCFANSLGIPGAASWQMTSMVPLVGPYILTFVGGVWTVTIPSSTITVFSNPDCTGTVVDVMNTAVIRIGNGGIWNVAAGTPTDIGPILFSAFGCGCPPNPCRITNSITGGIFGDNSASGGFADLTFG